MRGHDSAGDLAEHHRYVAALALASHRGRTVEGLEKETGAWCLQCKSNKVASTCGGLLHLTTSISRGRWRSCGAEEPKSLHQIHQRRRL